MSDYSKKMQRYSDGKSRICFQLLQNSKFLSGTQLKVLVALASYTGPVKLLQKNLSANIGIGISTLQKAVRKLTQLGLVQRSYRNYKKVTYYVVDIATQIKIASNPIVALMKSIRKERKKVNKKVKNIKNNLMNSTDPYQIKEPDPYANMEPIKEINKKEININLDKFIGNCWGKIQKTMTLTEKRDDAIRRLTIYNLKSKQI